MRKNFIKKAGLSVLGISMLILPAVNVSAAASDCIDPNAKASFRIHKYDKTAAEEDGMILETADFADNGSMDLAAEKALQNYAIQGVEFTYVKLGDIHTDREEDSLQVVYDIPETLEKILMPKAGREDSRYTSTELNQALMQLLSDQTAGKNALEQFVKNADGKQIMQLTDEKGETEASELPLGLYFVVETSVPENVHTTTDPFFLSLPMTDGEGDQWLYDVNVYPKNQTGHPDLDKLVRQQDDMEKGNGYEDETTASTGDVLDYIFVSHLPNITSEATFLKQYTFIDKIDHGLSYQDDFAIYFYDNAEDAKMNHKEQAKVTWEKNSPNFTIEYGPIPEENEKTAAAHSAFSTAKISVTEAGLKEINSGLAQMYMTVAYSCTVNTESTVVLGGEGNGNEVELTWSRTSSEYTDTIKDQTEVYVFGLHLQKNFEQQEGKTGDPTKVRFVLKNQTDGYFVTALEEEDGVYYVTDGTKVETEEQAFVFVPAENGQLLINGLEADHYVLTEIATDEGYSLLQEPVEIEIRDTVVDLTVLNSRSFKVPKTGDDGVIFFTHGGCAAALAGVVLALRRSRR